MQIRRHYELRTLTVTLHADDDPPAVECELEVTRDHVPETAGRWADWWQGEAARGTSPRCATGFGPQQRLGTRWKRSRTVPTC